MRTHTLSLGRMVVGSLFVPLGLHAGVLNYEAFNGALTVPDGRLSGLAIAFTPPALPPGQWITDVDVTLSIAGTDPDGGWNGDLYAWIGHSSTLSVLLNRTGRTAGDAFGYGDNGMAGVTFDDQAAQDVHYYGNSATPTSGQPLTGRWQPDGRLLDDPAGSAVSDDRSWGMLDVFYGLPAEGEWVLFVADASKGGTHELTNWQIHLTVENVPEPATYASVFGVMGLAWAGLRRVRGRKRPK